MKKLLLVAGLLAVASPLAAQTPEEVARAALAAAPVWDGHNDVPIQLRARFGNVIEDFDFADTSEVVDEEGQHMHTDLARLGEGMVGAQFWSVYVSAACTTCSGLCATSGAASAIADAARAKRKPAMLLPLAALNFTIFAHIRARWSCIRCRLPPRDAGEL